MMCPRCMEPIYHGAELKAIFDNEKIVVVCKGCYKPEDDQFEGDFVKRLEQFSTECYGRKIRITLTEIEAMIGINYTQDRSIGRRVNFHLRRLGFKPCSIRAEDQRVVSGWGRL